ncbi:MAG: hypothetical protein HRT58_10720 [Crocinitomicaceae bacterium]|nr:hypothetical protein [Flavobacteriales bacterium]NQZ36127.1 hypothetical protein [Crocinitomicaceae bacterium]
MARSGEDVTTEYGYTDNTGSPAAGFIIPIFVGINLKAKPLNLDSQEFIQVLCR